MPNTDTALDAAVALISFDPDPGEPGAEATVETPAKPAAEAKAEKPAEAKTAAEDKGAEAKPAEAKAEEPAKPPEPAPDAAKEAVARAEQRNRLFEAAQAQARLSREAKEREAKLAEMQATLERKQAEHDALVQRLREKPVEALAEQGVQWEDVNKRIVQGEDRPPPSPEVVALRQKIAAYEQRMSELDAWRKQVEQNEQARQYEAYDVRSRAGIERVVTRLGTEDRAIFDAWAAEVQVPADDIAGEVATAARQVQDAYLQQTREVLPDADAVEEVLRRLRPMVAVGRRLAAAGRPAAQTISAAVAPQTGPKAKPKTEDERLRAAADLLEFHPDE